MISLRQFIVNIPSMICMGFAGWLAVHGYESDVWGWFLFAGVMCIYYLTVGSDVEKDSN